MVLKLIEENTDKGKVCYTLVFVSKVVGSSYLLNGWGKDSGDKPEAGLAGSWANQP